MTSSNPVGEPWQGCPGQEQIVPTIKFSANSFAVHIARERHIARRNLRSGHPFAASKHAEKAGNLGTSIIRLNLKSCALPSQGSRGVVARELLARHISANFEARAVRQRLVPALVQPGRRERLCWFSADS